MHRFHRKQNYPSLVGFKGVSRILNRVVVVVREQWRLVAVGVSGLQDLLSRKRESFTGFEGRGF